MVSSVLRARQAMAWVAVVCAAALAVSCGSATSSRGPGPCATSALRVRLGPWDGAATSQFYRPLDFTNISGASCTLDGYPGVSFVAAIGGRQVGAAAGHTPASDRLVVLAPGGKAHAVLELIDLLVFAPSVCPMSTAHWLRVYPPGQLSASYVGWTVSVCSRPKPVFSFVGPVRQGA